MRRFLFVVICVGIILSLFTTSVSAYYTNMPATVVIGQPDFVSSSKNQCNCNTPAANTFNFPFQMIMVGSKLVVTDENNNRLLIYNQIPTTNNATPDVVIGQPDFVSSSANQGGGVTPGANTLRTPTELSTDGVKLFIADDVNHRILIYNKLPTSNNAPADVVIGQADFTHASANQGGSVGANTLLFPQSMKVYNGKLFVLDTNNFRILVWNSIPTQNNASADVVIGQVDFTHNSANQGGSIAANTLNGANYVAFINGRLLTVDQLNNRTLIYNQIPASNNVSADLVIGQQNFTSSTGNQGGLAAINTLNDPVGLLVTTDNRLLVADRGNHRVLIFPNTLITPSINLTNSPTGIGNGRYRLTGNVYMNNNGGTYGLQTLSSDLNGVGYSNVTFPGGRTDTGGNSTYDFTYDFDPTVGNGSISNLTIKLLASTFNADTNTLFYFLPFNFKSFNVSSTKSQNFTFSVNKDQLQRVKDNLDHFEISYKKNTTTGSWINYTSNISKSQIDNNGTVVATKTTNLTKFIGGYIFKITAVDNWGNKQDSNYLYTAGTTPITFASYPSFGKSFVSPVASISPSPSVQVLPTSVPVVIPTEVPVDIKVPSGNDNQVIDKTKLYLIFAGVVLGIIFLLLFALKRRKRKDNAS